MLTWSKIVQATCNKVYIIGGHKNKPSLLTTEYDVERSCLRVDLMSGLLEKMPDMQNSRRYGHGLNVFGKHVYVVGGLDD